MNILKKLLPDLAAIVLFIIIGFIYFFTPVSEGLVLSGADHTGAIGSNKELADFHEQTGGETRWTNSLFSGMPTWQMAPSYDSRSTLSTIRSIYELGLPTVIMYVFILLLGFYILMRAFGYKPGLSILGAIGWAFSSYFFIIIGAGHIWKVLTLAFIPPTIAGMVLCYKGKYLWGGVVLSLFLALQILSNHLQMTYYFLLVLFLMFVAYLVQAVRTKEMARFWKGTATMAIAAIIAVAANISNLYHTYEYSKETMRGRSELAAEGSSEKHGLSPEYITQWSYGIDETWTLLVPNAKGGASEPLSNSDIAMEKGQYTQVYNQLSMYWGDQPGTSGPVYVGAFILFLFVLGLFIIKGPMKWALLVATIISILLSWGHNFMGFTQFCIDYIPLYNKFRTVSSILVIAEFTIPLLGVMALAKVIEEKQEVLGKNMWKFYASFALTGGIALLFAIAPSLLSPFVSIQEQKMLSEQMPQLIPDLIAVRQAIFSADAWRSFFFVLIGCAIVWIYIKGKMKALYMVIAVTALCLIDMYGVNKRYLNNDMFTAHTEMESNFRKQPVDEQILQDKELDYRVLNFTTNTFNENETSYYHKSIGGYSAIKLGRYQDLIEHHIANEMQAVIPALNANGGVMSQTAADSICPVLNMLNDKYFIVGSGNNKFAVINHGAMGNAWFVENIKYVNSPNEEIAALSNTDLRKTAIVDNTFKAVLTKASAQTAQDSTSRVTLTKYEPNALEYTTDSKNGGAVVFSEIYYPGWTATIDGQPLELGRANYVLRTAYVPAGKHTIKMEYKPASITVTETAAYIAIILLLLGLIAAIGLTIKTELKTKDSNNE